MNVCSFSNWRLTESKLAVGRHREVPANWMEGSRLKSEREKALPRDMQADESGAQGPCRPTVLFPQGSHGAQSPSCQGKDGTSALKLQGDLRG